MLSAVLALNKQPGQTSFDCVRQVRRIYGERRVGHAGTLDPMARGLLPLCLGGATRLVDHFHRQTKRYSCTVRLGERSDTLDTEGVVTPGGDATGLDAERVRAALGQFVGEISQVPPMHSAVRHEGEHLYELARRGEEVERQPRIALIVSAELAELPARAPWPRRTSTSSAARGRSCACWPRDLGDALGVGGLLSWLERTRYGCLELADAHTVEELREMEDPTTALLPPEVAMSFLPAVFLGPPAVTLVRNGQPVFLPRVEGGLPQGEMRAHAATGELIAVGELTGFRFRPTKV